MKTISALACAIVLLTVPALAVQRGEHRGPPAVHQDRGVHHGWFHSPAWLHWRQHGHRR